MSTSRGNTRRERPQKHQNKTAFKNDLHDSSKKTKTINSLEVSGVCARCKEKIEWKIKYKKYKALTAPSKCVSCENKTVKYAYHVLCGSCANDKNVCAKCCTEVKIEEKQEVHPEVDIQVVLKSLPERKRRTILRCMNKQDEEKIENVLSKMNINQNEDDEFSDDFDDSSCDEK